MDMGMLGLYLVMAALTLLFAAAAGWCRGAGVERRQWEGDLERFLGEKLGKMFRDVPGAGVRKSPIPGDPSWSIYQDTPYYGLQPPTMMRRDIAVAEFERRGRRIVLVLYADSGKDDPKIFPVWEARRMLRELRKERSRILRARGAEQARTA